MKALSTDQDIAMQCTGQHTMIKFLLQSALHHYITDEKLSTKRWTFLLSCKV